VTAELRVVEPEPDELPAIVVNGRQQVEVIDEAWQALLRSPFGADLYLHAGGLVRLVRPEPRQPLAVVPLGADRLTPLLRRVATWWRQRGRGERSDADVPREVAHDMVGLPCPDLRPLDRVLHAPAMAPAGLLATAGYHPEARAYLDLPEDLVGVAPVPVPEAVRWLREELIGEFPFVGPSDVAHALAALLLPFVRPLIDGPTPLHVFEAPTEGTGKSLLAGALTFVATGREVTATTIAHGDDAMRKKLTAILVEGPSVVLLDNLSGTVDSASLAALLTSRTWSDRRLGETRMLALPNEATWLATGNNPVFSREIARRTVRIRLDARSASPWTGRGFRHPDLGAWVRAHHRELVAAALGLVVAWDAAGRPPGPRSLGSFERWAAVVGGVLAHAGVDGMLTTDAGELAFDPEEGEWRALVEAWWSAHAAAHVHAQDLLQLAHQLDLELGAPDRTEAATRSRFGKALRSRRARVYGDFRVCEGVDRRRNQGVYWLERLPLAA
jgi:putative DNA primase/helicase